MLSCPGLTGLTGGHPVRRGLSVPHRRLWSTGRIRPVTPGDDSVCVVRPYAVTTAGIGSVVTDLIFSIAKREVTFFSGTALISFL
ncbi:hypothetical protein ACVWWG_003553 [Bradyrhizobium sp. LB7.2]